MRDTFIRGASSAICSFFMTLGSEVRCGGWMDREKIFGVVAAKQVTIQQKDVLLVRKLRKCTLGYSYVGGLE